MVTGLYRWFLRITSRSGERGEYSAGYWQDRVRSAALEICRYKTGNLLDVGCGEGLFLARLVSSNPDIRIYGVDNREEILDKARQRLSKNTAAAVTLKKADALSLPFGDSTLDTVVCINVLFNMASLEEIGRALKEMARVCALGGCIIFDFRNALNPLLGLKYKLARYYDPTVKNLGLTTCRPDEIERFLKQMDFEITRKPYVSFPKGKFTPVILLEARRSR